MLRGLVEEFADLGLPALIKLGYPATTEAAESTSGSRCTGRRHTVEATLENSPYGVARLRAGDRGEHLLELVTDWTILTPFGSITPRSLVAARAVRNAVTR